MFDLSTEDLRGVWLPLVLPPDRRARPGRWLSQHLEALAGGGVAGLLLDASCGSPSEAERLLEVAAEPAAKAELPILADSERIAIERAEELGASAALVHLSPGDIPGYLQVSNPCNTTPIVLDGRGSGDWNPGQLREAHGAAPLLGYIHGGSEGEALDGLGAVQDRMGVLAPATIGHTAWRWGAHGLAGELLLLNPGWFARAWSGIDEGERDLADLELRLQRFEELALQPLRRRSDDPGLVAQLLAAWNTPEKFAAGLDPGTLATISDLAADLLPELDSSS